ncbi:hypothetical protein KP509_01G037200 [Ceratopteris richardii]|uniref:Uncharacterized protein n=1 Tax=Ceratopteris richardii TaxID=49495 RepID=A0A8T2VC67_CERRI|nr:hypothetical protein KP509_01G037200 [Ceratopteris richardii]
MARGVETCRVLLSRPITILSRNLSSSSEPTDNHSESKLVDFFTSPASLAHVCGKENDFPHFGAASSNHWTKKISSKKR